MDKNGLIDAMEDFQRNKEYLKETLEKFGDKEGKIVTSPKICVLFQFDDEIKKHFKLDIVDLVPEENEKISRYGYYKNLTIMRDHFARTDYIDFIDEE